MAANDEELLEEMTRVSVFPEATVIEVAEIHWPQTHMPFEVWHPLAVLPTDAGPDIILAARQKLLQRKQFFAVCAECGWRHAKGHMHSPTLCSSCAETHHGVVY